MSSKHPLPDTDFARPLSACVSAASYWIPTLIREDSTWLEHAPFGFWLVDALRPKSIVELGTHDGLSYFVLCEAVQRCCLDAQCYAIDGWTDPGGQGCRDNENFKLARRYNETHYHAFSKLLRSDGDFTQPYFDDGSVGLLHIENRRSYRAIKADFEQWQSKLSASGIILFHGTNAGEPGFGVARLWAEVKDDYRHFQFVHGDGLGVLGIGESLCRPLEDLFRFSLDAAATAQIRSAYSRLGMALTDRIRVEALTKIEASKTAAEARVFELQLQIGRLMKQQNYLKAINLRLHAEATSMNSISPFTEDREQMIRSEYINSTSWRVTRPLRAIKKLFSP